MAIKTVITCDVCGIDKKEVNHWWSVWTYNKEFRCVPGIDDNGDLIRHVCGVEHALTMFNRFLSHGTLEMEIPQAIMPLSPPDPPVASPCEEEFDLPF